MTEATAYACFLSLYIFFGWMFLFISPEMDDVAYIPKDYLSLSSSVPPSHGSLSPSLSCQSFSAQWLHSIDKHTTLN
jgi:hypothetical protein